MGMVLGLASVSDATIQRLLADPPLVWQVVAPDAPEPYDRAREIQSNRAKPGFLARLFGVRMRDDAAPPVPPAPLTLANGEGDLGDLDKAWHGIHYLLTGSADEGKPPLDFLVGGGADVGDEDLGYGSARVFTAAETRQIATALAALSDDALRARFAPAAMMRAGIYPEIWDRDPEDDDTLGYLMEYVVRLREALTAATSRGHGILVSLS